VNKPQRVKAKKRLRYMQTRLSDKGWKETRFLSVNTGMSAQTIVVEALRLFQMHHGYKPTITGPEDDDAD
jgi:hypothetical protein